MSRFLILFSNDIPFCVIKLIWPVVQCTSPYSKVLKSAVEMFGVFDKFCRCFRGKQLWNCLLNKELKILNYDKSIKTLFLECKCFFFVPVHCYGVKTPKCDWRFLDFNCQLQLYLHRRTGNFLPGGAVNHLPKKNLLSCPNFYERVEKKWGPYCNNIGRPGIWRWLDTGFQDQYQVWA